MVAPLAGFVIGVTGDRRAEEQAQLLEGQGAQVLRGALMRTSSSVDADRTSAATERALAGAIDHVVLTTDIGVRSWFGIAGADGVDDQLRAACARAHVVARGAKARGAASAQGLDVSWVAANETSSEIVKHLRDLGVAGRRIVVQRDGGSPLLASALRSLGADVVDVPVYRWGPPIDTSAALRLLSATVAGRVHAITFTSAHAVRMAFELVPDPEQLRQALNDGVTAVAVGPASSGALRARGVGRVVEPRRARLGAMVHALVHHLGQEQRTLRLGGESLQWQGDLLTGEGGRTATLTTGERRVLVELLRRAPAVVPKRALAEAGSDDHAAEAAVARLRTKLGPLAPGIRTIPRRGYSCTLDVSRPVT
jgi:uroporphyrinogen-III synthase